MSDYGTLDDRYFEWLYRLIGVVRNRNPARSHWELSRKMYTTPFYWFIRNDDNRVLDGKDLRYEFVTQQEIEEVDQEWMDLDCSFLEMLIALSRRVAFESPGLPAEWYWHLVNNLGLKKYTDAVYKNTHEVEVNQVLDVVVNRRYDYQGNGGLFPLQNDCGDQARTEIWYQMSHYLLEGHTC